MQFVVFTYQNYQTMDRVANDAFHDEGGLNDVAAGSVNALLHGQNGRRRLFDQDRPTGRDERP